MTFQISSSSYWHWQLRDPRIQNEIPKWTNCQNLNIIEFGNARNSRSLSNLKDFINWNERALSSFYKLSEPLNRRVFTITERSNYQTIFISLWLLLQTSNLRMLKVNDSFSSLQNSESVEKDSSSQMRNFQR